MEPRAAERSKVTHFPTALLIIGWLMVCDVVLAQTNSPDDHHVQRISSNSTPTINPTTTTSLPGKLPSGETIPDTVPSSELTVTWTRVVTSISVEYVTSKSVPTIQLDNVTHHGNVPNVESQPEETLTSKEWNKKADVWNNGSDENTSAVVVVELFQERKEGDDGSGDDDDGSHGWNGTKVDAIQSFEHSSPSAGSQVREGERQQMSAGAITGIVIAAVVFTVIVAVLFMYVIYQRSTWLGSKCYNSKLSNESSSYLDDSTQVSYINYHIDLAKDPCEEMSLDNDSFLNSLEAMTMKNYWADDCKNTKV